MKAAEQVIRWLGLDGFFSPRPTEDKLLRDLVSSAQRAKRAENYEISLTLYEQALTRAEAVRDLNTIALINLQRAEVYIRQQEWSAAEHLLLGLRRDAQNTGQRTHMIYALCALGTLAQAQGDWNEARAYYEQALKVAQGSQTVSGEGRALGYLADTYLHEENASYAVRLLREAVPKLSLSDDLELSSYFVGRLGEALILSGQEADGERLLYRALRLAEQTSHRGYERRWSLALGERALMKQRYEEAQKHYARGLALFPVGGVDADRLIARASLSRAYLQSGDAEKALDYARQAADEITPQASALLRAQAEGALGMALRASGNSAKALGYLQSATQHYQQVNGAGRNSLYVELLRHLAAAQADTADSDAVVTTYEQAIKLAQELDMPLEVAQTRVELGLLHLQRREMSSAIDQWSAALAIYLEEGQHAQVARLRCDIGAARKFLGQGQRALKEYEQALITLNSVEDWSTRGLVVSNAAVAYADMGEVESAEAFFNEAITIAGRLGDRAAEAVRRGNFGWFLLATDRPHQAVTVLEYALRMSQQQGSVLQVAVQTSNLGQAHDQLGNESTALMYHEQAYAMLPPQVDSHWRAVVVLSMANALRRRGRSEEAARLFDDALAQARATGDVEIIIGALTGKARVLLAQEQPEQTEELLREAVTLARRADMRRLLAGALRAQSEQQAALGQYDAAQAAWNEALRWFTVLHAPEASQPPYWLNPAPLAKG